MGEALGHTIKAEEGPFDVWAQAAHIPDGPEREPMETTYTLIMTSLVFPAADPSCCGPFLDVSRTRCGSFSEEDGYSAQDIRFTTKGATLYVLARPGGTKVNAIQNIRLLGLRDKVAWTQTADDLVVQLPAQKVSELTAGLKITGTRLTPVGPPETA